MRREASRRWLKKKGFEKVLKKNLKAQQENAVEEREPAARRDEERLACH